MKSHFTVVALITFFSAGSYATTPPPTNLNITLKGTVAEYCSLSSDVPGNTLELSLSPSSINQIQFEAWCNTESGEIQLDIGTGPLTHNSGETIPFELQFEGGTSTRIDSQNNTGPSISFDSSNKKVLFIHPAIHGREKAGEYQTAMFVNFFPK